LTFLAVQAPSLKVYRFPWTFYDSYGICWLRALVFARIFQSFSISEVGFTPLYKHFPVVLHVLANAIEKQAFFRLPTPCQIGFLFFFFFFFFLNTPTDGLSLVKCSL